MKERFVIVVVALIAGLFITLAGFFIFQAAKKSPDSNSQSDISNATPTEIPEGSIYVKISEPANESLTQKRTLQVKGATNPNNTIVVSTNQEDVTAKPTNDGQFSVTIEIDAGANVILTRAIAPNGDSVEDSRTVTYSTEEF